MDIYLLQDFLSRLTNAHTGDETWIAIQDQFCSLGFDFVNLGVINGVNGNPKGLFSNMPKDWINHYIDQKYVRVDPLLLHMIKKEDDFVFTEKSSHLLAGSNLSQAQKMYGEVAEVGIRSSFVSSFHNRQSRYITGFNLGSCLNTKNFLSFLEPKKDSIKLSVALAQTFAPSLVSVRHRMNNWVPINDRTNELTLREIETLNWLANGLRTDRIAEKMNVSNDTVNFHIKSIKKKLQAKTREHAIAIAFIENLIR